MPSDTRTLREIHEDCKRRHDAKTLHIPARCAQCGRDRPCPDYAAPWRAYCRAYSPRGLIGEGHPRIRPGNEKGAEDRPDTLTPEDWR